MTQQESRRIVDSDGTVRQSMDDTKGIGIADVTLDPNRKKTASDAPVCTGVGITELTNRGRGRKRGSREVPGVWQRVLDSNPIRKAKALAISGKH
jgi:hypothetical protein